MSDMSENTLRPMSAEEKNPPGGPNVAKFGPFDYSKEADEETKRMKALAQHDNGTEVPLRPAGECD